MTTRELFVIYRVAVPVPDVSKSDDAVNEVAESFMSAPELVFEMTPEYVGPVFEYTPPERENDD